MEYIEVPYSNGTTEKIPKKGQWAGNDGSLWLNGDKTYPAQTITMSEVLEIRRQADIMNNQTSSTNPQPPTLPPNEVSQEVDGNNINISGEPPPDSFGGSDVTGASHFPFAGSPPMGEGVPNGVFSVPRCGSRVWVFFHGGDIQKPVYFAYSLAPTDHQNFYGNPPPQPDEQKDSLPVSVQPNNQSFTPEIVEEPLPTQVPEPTQVPIPTQAPSLTMRNFGDKYTQ